MNSTVIMEPWRAAFRAAAGLVPRAGLLALRDALEGDDPALIQGATVSPPPIAAVEQWPAEACCPLGYCYWKAGSVTVGEVERGFAELCYAIDSELGGPLSCRELLNYIDDSPREVMRASLLAELEIILSKETSRAS